jgi:mannose-6-phosphate isomerase-like protein (cupin superfamily)
MNPETQRLVAEVKEPVDTYARMNEQQVAMAEHRGPSAFRVRAQMLSKGRTETVLAASNLLTVRLKMYASGGENTLHAHQEEDHVFIILQGAAEFFDGDGSLGFFTANQGVLLPKGSMYRFNSCEGEPLVMLRIGSPNEAALGLDGRVDTGGVPFDPGKDAKAATAPEFVPGRFYGQHG